MVDFCHQRGGHTCKREAVKASSMSSVTSNSSLSFEARELIFWIERLFILMPKKLPRGFLKFCLKAEI